MPAAARMPLKEKGEASQEEKAVPMPGACNSQEVDEAPWPTVRTVRATDEPPTDCQDCSGLSMTAVLTLITGPLSCMLPFLKTLQQDQRG